MRNRLIVCLLAAVCGAGCTDAYGQNVQKRLNTASTTQSSGLVSSKAYPLGKGDLARWDLTGKVSKCVWNWRYGDRTYNFNTVGKWTKLDGQALSAQFNGVKRNARGQITQYSGGDFDYVFTESCVYNSAGRLIKESYDGGDEKSVTTYKLDAKGRVLGYVFEEEVFESDMSDRAPGKTRTVVNYTYSSFDAKGNWTKRVATNDDGDSWTETRTITYYQ